MLTLTIYIEILTLVIAILNYHKFKNSIYKHFVFYLVFVVIIELIGFLFGVVLNKANHFIYNFYLFISFIFYFYFYKNIFKNKRQIKMMNVFIVLYIIVYLIEFIFIKGDFFLRLFNYSFVIGAILLVITLILFLIEIINDEKAIFKISKALIFWISIGLLLFHIGTIPILIASEYLNYNNLHKHILLGLNVILYGSIFIGFILADKKYNYNA